MDLIKVRPYKVALQNYINIIEQTNNLETFRNTLGQMLKIGLFAINATTGVISQYDSQKVESTVIAEANTSRANEQEHESDIGEVYDEHEFALAYEWLMGGQFPPLILERDKLPKDTAEYEEFIEYGFYTAIYLPILTNDQFWGYIEIWESRYPRPFNNDEIELLQGVAYYVTKALQAKDIAEFG